MYTIHFYYLSLRNLSAMFYSSVHIIDLEFNYIFTEWLTSSDRNNILVIIGRYVQVRQSKP